MRGALDFGRFSEVGRLLPSQVLQPKKSGERALMAAVLERALLDWDMERWRDGGIGEAGRWFESSRTDWPCAFVMICQWLDMDPQAVRRELKKRREAWLAAQRAAGSGGCSEEESESFKLSGIRRTASR